MLLVGREQAGPAEGSPLDKDEKRLLASLGLIPRLHEPLNDRASDVMAWLQAKAGN